MTQDWNYITELYNKHRVFLIEVLVKGKKIDEQLAEDIIQSLFEKFLNKGFSKRFKTDLDSQRFLTRCVMNQRINLIKQRGLLICNKRIDPYFPEELDEPSVDFELPYDEQTRHMARNAVLAYREEWEKQHKQMFRLCRTQMNKFKALKKAQQEAEPTMAELEEVIRKFVDSKRWDVTLASSSPLI